MYLYWILTITLQCETYWLLEICLIYRIASNLYHYSNLCDICHVIFNCEVFPWNFWVLTKYAQRLINFINLDHKTQYLFYFINYTYFIYPLRNKYEFQNWWIQKKMQWHCDVLIIHDRLLQIMYCMYPQ